MQKIYCFTDDNNDDIPLMEFETTCIPRIGETFLFKNIRYKITSVDHRLRADYGLNKHEIVVILKPYSHYIMKFLFTNDYVTQIRNIKKGTVCSVLNDVVVIDDDGKFLFDIDSGLAKRFGKIIYQSTMC